jgi:2-methylisocitrate lyase-like PEP mutase family enzyme
LTVGSHLSRVAQITAAVDVPVSVDVESGYGLWGVAADRGAARSRRSAAEHRRHCARRRQATAFDSDRVERAVVRSWKAAAGADVLYPVDRHHPETLRRLTSGLPLPVNAIALPDQDDPASFGPLGVGRISFGPFLRSALGTRAK